MIPSVGRIVHYFDNEVTLLPQAAIITEVSVFPLEKQIVHDGPVRFKHPDASDDIEEPFWTWPPRV